MARSKPSAFPPAHNWHSARGWAEALAALGLPVIPLRPGEKAPLEAEWQNRGRLASLAIQAAWPADLFGPPACNVGVVLGLYIDVDIDCEQAQRVCGEFLPATGLIFGRAGRGGPSHWIYHLANYPGDTIRRVTQKDRAELLLEVRGEGHQTMFPGSLHPDGEPVLCYEYGPPAEITLRDVLRLTGQLAAAVWLSRRWPSKGSRDDFAVAVTGGLDMRGMNKLDTERLIRVAATLAGDDEVNMRSSKFAATHRKVAAGQQVRGFTFAGRMIGCPEFAAEMTARCNLTPLSAAQTASREIAPEVAAVKPASKVGDRTFLPVRGPGRADDSETPKRASGRVPGAFVPLPVDCLPPVLRELVLTGSDAIGCDPAQIALPALAVLAGRIGNTRAIRLKASWVEPCCLWSAVVAASGAKKSPGLDLAAGPLMRRQVDLTRTHQQEVVLYRLAMQDWRRNRNAEDAGPAPTEPEPERIEVIQDITIEGVGRALAISPRGLTLIRDELDNWFQSFTRYSPEASSMGAWLEMHRGGPLNIRRASDERPPIAVYRALVSITGTIQHKVLALAFSARALAAGLAARFILAAPPGRPHIWTEATVPDAIQNEWMRVLLHLSRLTGYDGDDSRPVVLDLDAASRKAFVDFYNLNGLDLWGSADPEIAAVLSKLEGYAARLALVDHCLTCAASNVDDRRPVGLASMQRAVGLCRWAAAEQGRLYPLLREEAVLGREEDAARRLFLWLCRTGRRCTVREAQRGLWPHPTKEEARGLLDSLVQQGLGIWHGNPDLAGPGKAAVWFELFTAADPLADPEE